MVFLNNKIFSYVIRWYFKFNYMLIFGFNLMSIFQSHVTTQTTASDWPCTFYTQGVFDLHIQLHRAYIHTYSQLCMYVCTYINLQCYQLHNYVYGFSQCTEEYLGDGIMCKIMPVAVDIELLNNTNGCSGQNCKQVSTDYTIVTVHSYEVAQLCIYLHMS